MARVPESISFTNKLLYIPTLKEVGIPMADFGLAKSNDNIKYEVYNGYWVERGAPLLSYGFSFYSKEKPSLMDKIRGYDPEWDTDFHIKSPISGLILMLREEKTIDNSLGLQYQGCTDTVLPVILVPEDEPLPDNENFYTYNSVARTVASHFYHIPIRDYSVSRTERLRDYISKGDTALADFYSDKLKTLQNRDQSQYKEYRIEEISEKDTTLIRHIQDLRTKDINLREKLLHISRAFGTSI